MTEAAQVKLEEIAAQKVLQLVVRSQASRTRQHVRTRVTKLSNRVAEFQVAFPGEQAEEPVAFSKLVALLGTLEPLALQICKLDIEVLGTYKPDFEEFDLKSEEEEKIADYETLIREVEAYAEVVKQNKAVKVEVILNTSKAAIPTTPGLTFPPSATSTPGPTGGAVGGSVRPSFSNVKLPYLKLPEFSGVLTEWASFYDRFMGVIDKGSTCADAYKLEYLKGCLKGEPLKLLQGLSLTDDNYKIAMDILLVRYDDHVPIIAKHLESMLNFKTLTSKSCKDLRRLHDTFHLATQGLKQLSHPFDSYVLVFIFAQKLDPISRELWEAESTRRRKTGGRHTLPDMADIFDFVDERARTLDHVDTQIKLGGQTPGSARPGGSAHTSSSHVSGQNQPSDSAQSSIDACYTQAYDQGYSQGWRKFNKQAERPDSRPKEARPGQGGFRGYGATDNSRPLEKSATAGQSCTLCGVGVHELAICEKFRTLSLAERKSILGGRGMCVNCFRTGHGRVGRCNVPTRCKVTGCKEKHHTALHVFQA